MRFSPLPYCIQLICIAQGYVCSHLPDAIRLISFLHSLAILRLSMTNYGFPNSRRMNLTSDIMREKKEARKKLLDGVYHRRREIYKRFIEKKRRLQNTDHLL